MRAFPAAPGHRRRVWSSPTARSWCKVFGIGGSWAPQGARVVSGADRDRLYDVVPFALPLPPHLAGLLDVLTAATPLPPERVPPDLITMNSIVRVRDANGGEPLEAELVYPFDADRMPLARSVTAPFGAALFGRRVGEHVTCPTARGTLTVVVDSLAYQPEREGHYDR